MKHIVIVGGSRGIGLAAAKELAAAGHSLLLVGRDQAHLAAAGAQLPPQTLTLSLDASRADAPEILTAFLREKDFPVDGLVLGAAAFPEPASHTSVLKPSAEELSQMLERNVVTHYRLARALLPLVQEQQGRIVLVGSTAGIRQDKGGIYGISKWALRDLAYQLRDECKALGVGVSLVNPGGTFTERRVKKGPEDTTLLETSDLGKVIALIFALSRQAVVEQVDIRPIGGDTY